MRSEERTQMSRGHRAPAARANVPRKRHGWQAHRAAAMAVAALALGLCGVGTAVAQPVSDAGTATQLAADPGPKPRMEDFPDLTDYLIALLRWLYAVNGGDPVELQGLSVQRAAELVERQYQRGVQSPVAEGRLGEVLAASMSLTQTALTWKGGLFEQLALLRAATTVERALVFQ